jgi:hypothetical protein
MSAFEFDFTHWSELAINDPEAFEAERSEVIEQAINEASPEKRQRLHGLQWRIDQVRLLARTPLSACMEMSQMMWDSVMGEYGLIDILQQPLNQQHTNKPRPDHGHILPFPGRG